MSTDSQHRAAELRDIAKDLRARAGQLDKAADAFNASVPIPAPPSGFVGRTSVDPAKWREVVSDSFATLAPEGKFLSLYPAWDAYPEEYPVTDKSGHYSTGNLSVIDVDGLRVLNCALRPGNQTPDGKPWSAAPYPKSAVGLGLRVEMRVRVTKPVSGWHCANLMWPVDENWPRNGEIDFYEFDLPGTIGAYLHLQDATSAGDQVEYSTKTKPTDWHVICFEWLAGKSFKLFHDGQQIGKTVTSRVPKTTMRLVNQNESSGNPTEASAIQYDWLVAHTPV